MTTLLNPPVQFLRQHGQKLIALGFWLLLIAIYIVYTTSYDLSPQQAFVNLVNFMKGSIYGPVIFIGLYVLRPLIFFSAAVLTVAAGFLFGPLLGIVYTVIGSNIGASLAHFIGRFFAQDIGSEKGQGLVQRWSTPLRENSFETVFLMRLLFLPYDLVNYLTGFLRINYGAFILATILGALPGTTAFALFGASIEGEYTGGLPDFDIRIFIASLLIFLASLGLSRYLKARRSRLEA